MNLFDPRRILREAADDRGDAGGGAVDDVVVDDLDADDAEQARIVAEAKVATDAKAKADAEAKVKADAIAKAKAGIPKERFDEAVGKERALREKTEKELADARAQLAEANKGLDAEKVEAEIAKIEEALDAAIADGDKPKVAEFRKQIRAKVQALATAEATKQAAYATAVAVERVRYDAAVASLEIGHPQMNPDHADYDEALTNELIELKGAYEATGMGSTDALKKAAKYVFKEAAAAVKKEPEVDPDETEEEKTARLAKEVSDKKEVAEKVAKAKEEAIRKAQEARGKQPAAANSGKVAAKDGAPASVARMSDADFEKLPKEEKARLRGDTL